MAVCIFDAPGVKHLGKILFQPCPALLECVALESLAGGHSGLAQFRNMIAGGGYSRPHGFSEILEHGLTPEILFCERAVLVTGAVQDGLT